MRGCLRFAVGLIVAVIALDLLAELSLWAEVPFASIALLAALLYGGGFAARAYYRAFRDARAADRAKKKGA